MTGNTCTTNKIYAVSFTLGSITTTYELRNMTHVTLQFNFCHFYPKVTKFSTQEGLQFATPFDEISFHSGDHAAKLFEICRRLWCFWAAECFGRGPPNIPIVFYKFRSPSNMYQNLTTINRASLEIRCWKKEIKKSMTQQNSIDLCHGAGDARLWLISTVLFVAMVHAATGHSQAPTYSIWFTGICLFYSVSLSPKQCEITPCL